MTAETAEWRGQPTPRGYDETAEWGNHDPDRMKAATDWDLLFYGEAFVERHEDGRTRRVPPPRVTLMRRR